MHEEIRSVCGQAEADGFVRFAKWLGELYRLEQPNFIDRNFDSPLDLAWPPGPIVQLLRMGGLRKLSSVVGDYFSDDRLQRLFSFQAMYAGLSPFEALAIYAVITYMDSVEGVFFPRGGMHAIPRELARAAEKAGATFVYNTTVTEFVRSGNRVTGVRTSTGELISSDCVVANPDLPVVYRDLLPDVSMPRVARTGKYSPSCMVLLGGVRDAMPEGTAHHNIHFGGQWSEAFRALFDYGRPMPDPSILVTSPTVSDPSLAPDGRSIIYALEPVPNLDGHIDWAEESGALRSRLTAKIASFGYPTDFEVQRFVDPLDWQRQGMERGTPFALSHRFRQTGPFRPNNVDSRVPGVVFVGSGTVPGVGVPMVLVSGRLAAERVEASGE
jgi:phytoene desaturase